MQADLRPAYKKLTNIGLALAAVAGTLAPWLADPYRTIALAVAAAGAALAGKGAARRADRLRAEMRRDYR